MRARAVAAFALCAAAPAFAAEPSGCDQFKWPIERERAAITAPDRPSLRSGAEISTPGPAAMTLSLRPPAEAQLPSPPERAPKEGTFAGFARFRTVPKAGVYIVSLSAAAWIDVVQDGHILKPVAFSGASDCDGVRKTMKYELTASPFVVQVSGIGAESISLAVSPPE